MKKLNKVYTALIFLFLYLPMFVLIVASFNTGKDITDFEGFTLSQYAELFRDHKLLPLLGNSLEMALLSSLIATVMGTAAAMGIHRMRPRHSDRNQYPHDKPGYRHRCLSVPVVCVHWRAHAK